MIYHFSAHHSQKSASPHLAKQQSTNLSPHKNAISTLKNKSCHDPIFNNFTITFAQRPNNTVRLQPKHPINTTPLK